VSAASGWARKAIDAEMAALDRSRRLARTPRAPGETRRFAVEADEHGNASVLDAATWHERRDRLAKLGGSPVE